MSKKSPANRMQYLEQVAINAGSVLQAIKAKGFDPTNPPIKMAESLRDIRDIAEHRASKPPEPLQCVEFAQQGHPYLFEEKKVVALESGTRIKVLIFNEEKPWESRTEHVRVKYLTALPLKYLHGAMA